MLATILRRWPLLIWLVLLAGPAQATHLLGGEMTYRFLDLNGPAGAPVRYEITVTIYNNSNPGAAPPNTDALVGIYNVQTGEKLEIVQGVNVLAGPGITSRAVGGALDIRNYTLSDELKPAVPAGCTVSGPAQPFRLQKFTAIVNLPATVAGYYAVFTRSARNVEVTNLITSNNNEPLTLYTTLAPPLLPNRSPVFSDTAVAIVCQGDTTISLNNAVDPDGDRLVYSFGAPYGVFMSTGPNLPFTFPPLPQAIAYYPGYSVAQPFGAGPGNFATINAATGVATYGASTQGKYVVAVDVREYRTVNGREVLVGTTRRDLQLIVARCPATRPPVLPSAAVTPRSYVIEAGQTLNIPITATQPDGDPLVMTLNSVLLDGPGGFQATFNNDAGNVAAGAATGTASAFGNGSVTGTFVYNSACGDARATPYDIALTVKDRGCGGKAAADVIRITVTRPAGPTAISGDALVCLLNSVSTYTASGGTAPGVRWRVVGGTIVGSPTANPVQVKWTAAGTGQLVARGVSGFGCPTDSVALTVAVAPAGALTIAGSLRVCQGSSTTLSVAGGAGPFVLTGGGLRLSGAGPFVVTPTQTTTYTINGTTLTGDCARTGQATVTVIPLPAANVGAPTRAGCAGLPLALGALPVPGNTYQWSPATGLSDPTAANPTLTLPNATGAPLILTYTLTETTAPDGCAATNSVVITVNPAAVAAAGPAQAVCDGSTITLGVAPRPGYVYQWTPATGLSSPTAAQPVLTGSNPTSAPIVRKFVVRATNEQGCFSQDSVLITINPRPAADSLTGPQSVCPTITGVAYSIKKPRGTTYQWTVTGGTIAGGQGTAAITVNWGAAGAGAVRAVATNAQGCASDGFTLPVRINPVLQTARPTGPVSVCQADGPYPYQTLLTNGSSYGWQLFGSATGTLVSNLNTTSITFTRPGVARLVVTETSNPAGGRCRGGSDTLFITVKPSPAANLAIQGPARFCVDSGPQTYLLPGAAGAAYAYQLNGAALTATNGAAIVPASTAAGTYVLTARETSAGGCAGPLYTKTFVVDPRPVAAVISGPRFVCPAARTLTYAVANPIPGSGFQWTVAGATLTSGQGTASITVEFPAGLTANATVSVTETSSYGCAGAPVTITIVPDNAQAPRLTLASVVPTDNTKVTLTFSVANPAATPNPMRVLRRAAGTAAYAQVGTVAATATTYVDATANAAQTAYEYSLALTNGCGDELPAPTPATTVLLQALAMPGPGGRNQGSVSLSWSAYQGFAVAGYTLYQQNDNGGYQLLATVSGSTLQYSLPNAAQGFNQCFRVVAFSGEATPRQSNSNSACVEFANKTAFYNIITPNGDGQNDLLIIDNVQLYPGNSLTIFNRWGREVFATTNYNNTNNAWGGDPGIAAGVYYYLFKLPDGSSTKGWVEVVR